MSNNLIADDEICRFKYFESNYNNTINDTYLTIDEIEKKLEELNKFDLKLLSKKDKKSIINISLKLLTSIISYINQLIRSIDDLNSTYNISNYSNALAYKSIMMYYNKYISKYFKEFDICLNPYAINILNSYNKFDFFKMKVTQIDNVYTYELNEQSRDSYSLFEIPFLMKLKSIISEDTKYLLLFNNTNYNVSHSCRPEVAYTYYKILEIDSQIYDKYENDGEYQKQMIKI